MKYLRLTAAACALFLLASCASGSPNINTQLINPLITALSRIGNTGVADLGVVVKVASVPNANLPGGITDQDGKVCAQTAITVLNQVNLVLAAANVPTAGVLTTAELASLFQPGSANYNQANNALGTGCLAKANDVLGPAGVVAAGGVVGALAISNGILPLAAAAP